MRHILLILFVITSHFTFAQQNPTRIISYATPIPNDTLIVINGKPTSDGKVLNLISAKDIENIEVLKDAASAAIYGIRGANGVIIVTLKKNVKLLPYEKLLEKFRVRKEYRQYMSYLDNQPINNTAEFYASPSRIKDIRLQWRSNGISQIPYLNIVTNE